MTRYRVLRRLGCGPVSAGLISFFNWGLGVPYGEIRFMHITIEFEDKP